MMGPDELGRLIDAHSAALALYARQWSLAPEDVVQLAFVKLAGLKTSPADTVAWLYSATKNLARTAGRSERRRRRHESLAASRAPTWFVPTEGIGLDGARAAAALIELPDEEREVIVARIWGGLSFEQIGPLIDASAATAHRRFVAGLAKLRTLLSAPCPTTTTISTH